MAVGDGEVALVPLHRRDEHRVGQREEGRVEVAGDRHRPFDECGVLCKQFGIDERLCAECARFAFDLLADALHARLEPGHDAAFLAERRLVPSRVFERDAPRPAEVVVEAVPAGGAPGADPEDLRLDDLPAVHQHHPVHGAHELGVAIRPPHAPRRRQAFERAFQHSGQQRGQRRAGLGEAVGEPCAGPRFEPHEPIHLDPGRSREAEGGPRRLAVLVEGLRERRPAPFDLAVGLGAGHAGNEDREPPRGGIRDRGAAGEPCRVELRRDPGRERLGEPAQRLRRQLFRADLHQQVVGIGHGAISFPFPGEARIPRCSSPIICRPLAPAVPSRGVMVQIGVGGVGQRPPAWSRHLRASGGLAIVAPAGVLSFVLKGTMLSP